MAEVVKSGGDVEAVRQAWPGPIDQVPLLDTTPVQPAVAAGSPWVDDMEVIDTIDLTAPEETQPQAAPAEATAQISTASDWTVRPKFGLCGPSPVMHAQHWAHSQVDMPNDRLQLQTLDFYLALLAGTCSASAARSHTT